MSFYAQRKSIDNNVPKTPVNKYVIYEEVFARFEDSIGNYHWFGTETGHHIIKSQDPISNFEIPEKCKYCGYYYNFVCRAEHCIYEKEGDAYVSKRKSTYNVAKHSKEGKMKTIEEMIATLLLYEWQKIIRSEMNELRLCFSEDTEYRKENLFDE